MHLPRSFRSWHILSHSPALLGLALTLLAIFNSSLQAAEAPPNVVLIISDDQAWDDYGFMGHEAIETPHLDRLARESLLFTRGYVPSSLCRPSLVSIITGLYPHQHGVTGNDPLFPQGTNSYAGRRSGDFPYHHLLDSIEARVREHPTLPRLLGERGYTSLQTGKWWEGPATNGGFTQGMTHGDRARGGRHGDDGLAIGRKGLQTIGDFIDQSVAGEDPFFVWYAPFLPHTPHNPPERLLNKYRSRTESLPIAKYWAMCEWFDETCGDLLAMIDDKGLSQNTLVVYVTDNGWINQRNASRYAPRSKRSPYDGGIRTPIMLRMPDRIQPKRDDRQLASSLDLAPTILSLCGLAPTEEMPGVNLLDQEARTNRQTLYGEIFDHDIANVEIPTQSLQYRWIIDGNLKLIAPHKPNVPEQKVELFDLGVDPHEQTNLAPDRHQEVERLQAALDAWWKPAE